MARSAHRVDRRTAPAPTRGHTRLAWDVAFRALRFIGQHAQSAYTVFGIFLVSGAVVAAAGTWTFAEVAGHVQSGKTQAFDDAVMRWLGSHQYASVQSTMLEITALGTGIV